MIRLQRPGLNAAFEQRVAKVREEIRAAVEQGEKPKISKSLWSDFKLDFSVQQHGRCGYCETNVVVGHHGDVEHYAPKSEVTQFGPNGALEEGTETKFLARLEGRSPSERWSPGYWWLAYDWANYLLACSVCNSVWKGTLFPVKQPPARAKPHLELDPGEHFLLLNPYGSRDPARHLRFNPDGSVEPRRSSVYGRETIRTCGLNRLALRDARRPTCQRVFAAVSEAVRQLREGIALIDNEGLRDLHRMGLDGDDAEFPGVVRAIILEQLNPLTWDALDELLGQP